MKGKRFVNRQLQFWRFAIPSTVVVLSVCAVLEMKYPLGRIADLLLWISWMDPLLLIAHVRSTLAIPDWIWLPFLMMLLTAILGRAFCGWLCPMGGLLNRGSGEECLVCGRCVTVCYRQAIHWTSQRQSVGAGDRRSRRNFLKLGAAIATCSLINLSAPRILVPISFVVPSLRPPGALPESDFLATCNRCSRCVKVCPTGGLVPMSFSSGIIAYETPELIPRKGACDLCMQCFRVCPTGAIRQIKVKEVKIGVARLDEQTCLAWAQGKACLICKERCLADAITIDDGKRPYIQSQKCIGCGACENACPVEEAAVKVVPKDE